MTVEVPAAAPAAPSPEDPAAFDRQAWRVALVCAAGTFVFVLDSGLLSIAFPSLAHEFSGTNRATLSWAATGFAVVMAGCMAFAGSVADRFGRKRVYLAGLGVYAIAGTLGALSPGVGLFIAARLVQGAGAAFFVTAGLALALLAFPASKRSTALGLWGIVGSAAAIVAPTVGALVLEHASWRWAFGGMAAIAFASVVLGLWLPLDTPTGSHQGPPDPVAVVSGAAGVALVVLAISRSRIWGWDNGKTVGCLVAGIALVAVVGLRSHRHPRPLVPSQLARHREYLMSTLAAVIQQIGFFAFFFSQPLILIGVWGWSTLEAGYAMAFSMTLSVAVVPPATRWIQRRGYLGLILMGTLLASLAWLWWLMTFETEPDFWFALLPGLVLMGIGGPIIGNFVSGPALDHVPSEIMGQGNSLHQMSRRVGGAIGVALAIALLGESSDPAELLDGARELWAFLIAVHVVMAAVFVLRKPRSRRTAASIPSS